MWWDRKYRNLFSFIFPLPIGRSDLSHCLCVSTGTPDVCELERVHQHCHCLLILHSHRSAEVRFHFSGVIGKILPTEYGANPRAISYCTKQEFCICLCYQHCSGFAHTCTAGAETPAPPAPPKALSTLHSATGNGVKAAQPPAPGGRGVMDPGAGPGAGAVPGSTPNTLHPCSLQQAGGTPLCLPHPRVFTQQQNQLGSG